MNIDQYIGIPYKDKGRDKDGLDCWGLLRLIYKEQLNIDVFSYTDQYDDIKNFKPLADLIKQNISSWIKIEKGNEQIGDGVLLRILGHPIHVGIIIKIGTMIHVIRGANTCLQKMYGLTWEKRIIGIYRHQSLVKN